VHVSTTQEVVDVGLRTILERADAPFTIVTDGDPLGTPDVVLFDVIHMSEGDTVELERWLKDSDTTVIAIDRTLKPELGVRARESGVEWSITLGITAQELVQVITESIAGELDQSSVATEWDPDSHLGAEAGLSPRESEVLRGVVMGRSNHEIAEEMFLSINSVKTYIRSTYRKIGVTGRGQAILWGISNGFPTGDTDADTGTD
jgi:DNA-binding NarL/FixJ family response regulator